jgi:hypothetical protein
MVDGPIDCKLLEDNNVNAVRVDLPPPDFYDPVIEAYKQGVDRTLLREHLELSPDQRVKKFVRFLKELEVVRGAASRLNADSDRVAK